MPELATFSSSVADILRNRFSKQAFLNAEFPDYHDSGRCVDSSLARTFFSFLKKYLIWTIDFDPVPGAVPPPCFLFRGHGFPFFGAMFVAPCRLTF